MDIICFSHLRWGFVFQRPNHLMSRFARSHRVFFLEEPVIDDGARGPWLETQAIEPRLLVCTPHLQPGMSDEQAVRAQRQLLDALIEEHAIARDLAWFYTPMALRFARHLAPRVVVYDCMDELTAFRGAPPQLGELERELLRRAQLVFTGGVSLYRAKAALHPRVHAFPSSVDAAHFASAQGVLEEPSDQRELARPRIGYFGVIDERLDLSLLARIADARPEWPLIMVGPLAKLAESDLPCRPNIHWLGARRYDLLPHYLAGWDVAIMPFALNDATRFISPTKTLEYLAAGKPVVSTAVADVVQPYGEAGVVTIASADDFVQAIEAALSRTPLQRMAADAIVAATSWDRTWQAMDALISEQLGASARAAEAQAHV